MKNTFEDLFLGPDSKQSGFVCPSCGGKHKKGYVCTKCGGIGTISREEAKKLDKDEIAIATLCMLAFLGFVGSCVFFYAISFLGVVIIP